MSANLSARPLRAFGLALWVVFSLIVGQSLVQLIVVATGAQVNLAVQTTVVAALGYALALALAVGVPVFASKKKVSLKTLGFDRLPLWTDIGVSILAVLPYYILTGLLLWLLTVVIPVVDPEVGQELPFSNLNLRIEYIVAFITLVVLAPLGEELLFRGYFLGKLNELMGKWLAVLISALVFGLMHLPGFTETGVTLQWGAVADTFTLGLVLGSLRMLTGSVWAGILLHAIKNGIAFYFLFINPLPPGS